MRCVLLLVTSECELSSELVSRLPCMFLCSQPAWGLAQTHQPRLRPCGIVIEKEPASGDLAVETALSKWHSLSNDEQDGVRL